MENPKDLRDFIEKKLNSLEKLRLVQEILGMCEEGWERENMLGFLRGWIWKEEVKENTRAERRREKEC